MYRLYSVADTLSATHLQQVSATPQLTVIQYIIRVLLQVADTSMFFQLYGGKNISRLCS